MRWMSVYFLCREHLMMTQSVDITRECRRSVAEDWRKRAHAVARCNLADPCECFTKWSKKKKTPKLHRRQGDSNLRKAKKFTRGRTHLTLATSLVLHVVLHENLDLQLDNSGRNHTLQPAVTLLTRETTGGILRGGQPLPSVEPTVLVH